MESKKKIKVIPLGGLGEIGKNITVIEYGDEIVVVDCGMTFPDSEMYGIDVVIPDVTYLVNNIEKVKGFFITHGHEEFLVYRSIVNVEKLRNKIGEYQLYEKMQIKEYIPLFEKLDGKIGAEIMDEKVFSFYQRKHKNPIYDNYILEDKNKKLMSENNKISNQNIELEKKQN